MNRFFLIPLFVTTDKERSGGIFREGPRPFRLDTGTESVHGLVAMAKMEWRGSQRSRVGPGHRRPGTATAHRPTPATHRGGCPDRRGSRSGQIHRSISDCPRGSSGRALATASPGGTARPHTAHQSGHRPATGRRATARHRPGRRPRRSGHRATGSAQALWLPSLFLGADYARQDGQLQDVVGNVFNTNKSSLLLGAGPSAVFALSDAIYAPLAARQVRAAREAGVQIARNDSLLAVAEAYFTVQQARGELAGAGETVTRSWNWFAGRSGWPRAWLNRWRRSPPDGIGPPETSGTVGYERWQTASSANLVRCAYGRAPVVETLEPPHLAIQLLSDRAVDDRSPWV